MPTQQRPSAKGKKSAGKTFPKLMPPKKSGGGSGHEQKPTYVGFKGEEAAGPGCVSPTWLLLLYVTQGRQMTIY